MSDLDHVLTIEDELPDHVCPLHDRLEGTAGLGPQLVAALEAMCRDLAFFERHVTATRRRLHGERLRITTARRLRVSEAYAVERIESLRIEMCRLLDGEPIPAPRLDLWPERPVI